MAALQEFAEDLASGSLFHFFCALDGSDAFEGDVRVELRLDDGERVPGGLHECFYPIERDDENFDCRFTDFD